MSDSTRVRRSIFLRNPTRVVPVASGASGPSRLLTMSAQTDGCALPC
jgi:hypothetical protein